MKEKLVNIGAITSAFVASLCCTVPIAFAILGLGGAGFVVGLEKYRPYFVAITIIFLGAAFYFTYQKREIICDDGSCKIQRGSKRNKMMLWLITAITLLFLVFPYFNWDSFSASTEINEKQTVAEMETSVEGMTCVSCNNAIEIAVSKIDGVITVKADYQSGKVTVNYNADNVDKNEIINEIDNLGYRVQYILMIER
jgi:copper chaperone CopZ